jgi:hypothetical protein
VVDQIHELKKSFTDLIVVRLKRSASWLPYVMIHAEPQDSHFKLNTIFSNDYSPDLLLQSIQDFIDVNDIATVNTVYNDVTQMYGALNNREVLDNKALFA